MNGKVVYFEKYSVAPSPSRDYYGIKIFHDEVVLLVWRVSHGPHRTPVVRVTKFFEFAEDKSFQDQICQVFGKPLLQHIMGITLGECKTLLTLPRNLINKLSEYLNIQDIVKLSSLSHAANQIFHDNELWKILYKRCLNDNISRHKNDCAMVKGWRNLTKDHQIRLKTGHGITDSVKRVDRQFRKTQETSMKANRAALQNLKLMKTMNVPKTINNSHGIQCDTEKHNSHNQTNKASSCKIRGFQTLREVDSIDSVQGTLESARLHPTMQTNKSLQDVRSESVKEEKRLSTRSTVKKHINSTPKKLDVSNATKTERFEDTSNADSKSTCIIKKEKADRKSKQIQNNYTTNNAMKKSGCTKKLHVKIPVSSIESNTTRNKY